MQRWESAGDGSSERGEGEAAGAAVTVRNEPGGDHEVAATGTGGAPGGAGVDRPDEDGFVLPVAWRRLVQPRRGGVRRTVPEPHAEAGDLLAGRLGEEREWIEEMLAAPRSEPEIVDAIRAQLKGSPSPLGAAALTPMTLHYQLPEAVFVDAWVSAHGPVFTARAVLEYFDIEAHWTQYGARRENARIGFRPATAPTDAHWTRPFADRMRALLAVADEDAYRRTVAMLSKCRTSTRRRVVVSYLVPGERDWVAETCAEADRLDPTLRAMLLCSLHSPAQLVPFGTDFELAHADWSMSLVTTLAEGVGPDIAPVLRRGIEAAHDSDRVRTFAGALVELPTDDAFRVLLERADDKNVRPSLMEAARRWPVRALRLMGAAAGGASAGGAAAAGAAAGGAAAGGAAAAGSVGSTSTVERLLVGHIAAHPELTAAVLPELPAQVAEFVAPRLALRDRVAEAPAEALPELLVSPPWTRPREAVRARVAAEPPAVPEPRVVWLPGERESWSAVTSWYASWRGGHEWREEIAHLRSGGRLSDVREALLFVTAPEDVVRPLLAHCAPEDYWDGEASLKPVAARFGVDALPLLLSGAARQPATLNVLVMPFLSVELAGLVADWLARLKSADAAGRAWLRRHGTAAVPYLVPHAVGRAGHARRGAERALRLLAEVHGAEAVRAAAAGSGPQAADLVAAALAADPLVSALPARLPAVGAWAEPALLPQLVLKEGGALPAEAVHHALTVLALSKPGDVYPGLDVLTEVCTAESLAAFSWGLFELWLLAGMPPKESWALHALGWFGDDDTVRRLTPVLRAWPGEGAHHRAVEGLTVLASIGTDVALLHLHTLAQRVPFKALKLRAQEKIAEVAEGLGLTAEQLGDRLVPDCGLDADGGTVIDYGTRRFRVGFDEKLRPFVQDADGRPRKALPAPAAKDDPELAPAERKRFAALKKDVRAVAGDQVRRLEAAMVTRRSWTAAEFRELFVAHPLLWHLVRRLVWLRESDDTVTAFRVVADRTFADVGGEVLALPEGAGVRLAHPLDLGGELEAWSELFAGEGIVQPFPQLGRAVH
ncbi:DUF4132 domain-containing protein, partial [Streptomyces sp. NPDC003832]